MEAGFFSGFLDWLMALVHQWEVIVVTGAIPFALELVEKLLDWKMPKRLYLIIVVVGLFLANFAAWRDEHEKALSKETRVKVETEGAYIPQPMPVFGGNQKTGMNFGVRNTGNFEADSEYVMRNLEIHGSATRYDHTDQQKNPTSTQIEDEVFSQLKKDEPKDYPKHSMDPGDKAYMTAWTTHPLSPEEMQELEAQDKLLYLVGFVDWTDGSGTHEREFCYWLHLPINRHYVWDECLSHNDFLKSAKDF